MLRLRGLITAVAMAAALAGATAPPASASVGSATVVHHWSARHYLPGIRMWGAWHLTKSGATATGKMRDTRKDGRWVHVILQARNGAARAESDFFFHGGRQSYTTPRFEQTQTVGVRLYVKACLLKSLTTRSVYRCGKWRRIA